jgi:MraZ protein
MHEELKANTVYSGTFERSMDAKNRLTIPAKWLSSAGENEFQSIPNPKNEFLILMPPEEFASIERRIEATSRTPMEKRKAIRQFYGLAQSVSVDKQGRVLLPDDHCRKVGLSTDVVLIGSKSRFEIWNRDRWLQTQQIDLAVYEAVAEEIGL